LPVIRSEEEFLNGMFPGFQDYCRRVPRLFPRLTPGSHGDPGSFSSALYRRHREYNALMGATALYVALLLRLYFRR
jgi:hypothetical protein